MPSRIKLILASLVFPLIMILLAICAGFFTTPSVELYIGIAVGVYLGLHLCWASVIRWDSTTLQSISSEASPFLSKDGTVLGNIIISLVFTAIISGVFNLDMNMIYGVLSTASVIIFFGYVIAKLIVR